MDRETIKILADIIKNGMSLTDEQIFIYNQDYVIPETSGLFIVLQNLSSNNYSTNNTFIPQPEGIEGAQESITMLTREEYLINIISKNDEARQRKEEVILSINSNFSKNKQELYQFKIANLSNSFLNVSELEGAGIVNRFAINISVLAYYNNTINTDYYDNNFINQIETD
jgi:hypothetical protein